MITAIADTSFVVALANQKEIRRADCFAVYEREDGILLPQSTLGEIGYLLTRAGGNRLMVTFLLELPTSRYQLMALDDEDLLRTAQLLTQYADTRLDFVDASLVAVAERQNIRRILTFDQRDFRLVRPLHAEHLELLPDA